MTYLPTARSRAAAVLLVVASVPALMAGCDQSRGRTYDAPPSQRPYEITRAALGPVVQVPKNLPLAPAWDTVARLEKKLGKSETVQDKDDARVVYGTTHTWRKLGLMVRRNVSGDIYYMIIVRRWNEPVVGVHVGDTLQQVRQTQRVEDDPPPNTEPSTLMTFQSRGLLDHPGWRVSFQMAQSGYRDVLHESEYWADPTNPVVTMLTYQNDKYRPAMVSGSP